VKFTLRKAIPSDIPALTALIELSVRELQKHDYSQAQLDGALASVFGVDSQLVADGTYFVVEALPEGVIAGCGGWSMRKTLYGGDQWVARQDSLLDPRYDAAKIRAFFVHPAWSRRGVGSLILESCETSGVAAGFTRFEMGATLTGVPLYRARGYVELESLGVPLNNGETLPIVRMVKEISGSSAK
jgi:GNAT superfamily N-acetyltransferase